MFQSKDSTLSDWDIREIVPMDVLKADSDFYNYVIQSNENIGQAQILGLVKIKQFVKNE